MNTEVATAPDNKLLYNKKFEAVLKASGIESADALWNFTGETVKKVLPERGTERVLLTAPDGEKLEAYVKRYGKIPVKQLMKGYFSLKFKQFDAFDEWDSILEFQEKNIPSPEPLAVGESPEGTVCMTLGLTHCVRASELFAHLEKGSPRRMNLIQKIAVLAASMHNAGLAHQDFYLVHIFVRESNDDKLYLIDLQRVIKDESMNDRWVIKDLGEMIFSMTAAALTLKEIMFFCHVYKQNRGLMNPVGRRLIRNSFIKGNKILARDQRKLEEKKQKFGLK